MKSRRVLMVILAASLIGNAFGLYWQAFGDFSYDESSGEGALKEAYLFQASIGLEDIDSYVRSFLPDPVPSGLYAMIPPFSCSRCIEGGLVSLSKRDEAFTLLVPESMDVHFSGEIKQTAIIYSAEQGADNPVCSYPDLVFFFYKDNRLADYYLHNKDVPEAMIIFLQGK